MDAPAAEVPATASPVVPVVVAPEPERRSTPEASTLNEEAELLQRALAALHAGDRATAGRLLAAHEARFPNSVLMRERERARRHLEQLSE